MGSITSQNRGGANADQGVSRDPQSPGFGKREFTVAEIVSGTATHRPGASSRLFHHHWAVIVIERGGYRVGGEPPRTFDAGAGDLIIMTPETDHAWTTVGHPAGMREGLVAHWALFQIHPRLEPLLRYPEAIPHYRRVHVADRMALRRIVRCFRQMAALSDSTLAMRSELQFLLLEQALVWCANAQAEALRRMDPRLSKAIEHMATHLADSITLDDLCTAAGVSRTLLVELFQRDTDHTPMRYLERLRIEKAMQLLRLSTQHLDELAAAVGFCDAKHFSRRFHMIVGTTPSEYRRSAGK